MREALTDEGGELDGDEDEAFEEDTGDDGDDEDDAPLTARDVVAGILDPDYDAAILESTDGELDGLAWLHWAATADAREWAEAERAAGYAPGEFPRPGQSDWPRNMQTQALADRLDDRLQAIREGRAHPL